MFTVVLNQCMLVNEIAIWISISGVKTKNEIGGDAVTSPVPLFLLHCDSLMVV